MKGYNGFSAATRQKVDDQMKAAVAAGTYTFERKCSMCALTAGYIWLHQEDYAHPLTDSRPICVECHMTLHARYSLPNRWFNYCAKLRNGHQPPVYASNGHYFARSRFPSRDESLSEAGIAVVTDPNACRWWECLSMERDRAFE